MDKLMTKAPAEIQKVNSVRRVLTASMIGTTIEFFDFYIYATAAVIVFPHLFFRQAMVTQRFCNRLRHLRLPFLLAP
ncbi:hypothetical protein C7374_10366 [Falsochrobactrum ovis]|uniref:Sugar transport protein n=1 Tax=Falsochrobactrum ovis TaxID=1293442 RepID=A0A364JWB4_9HYPH|nr:hypothetical protein C7374_10366 [Falsochrobactrum ovis]